MIGFSNNSRKFVNYAKKHKIESAVAKAIHNSIFPDSSSDVIIETVREFGVNVSFLVDHEHTTADIFIGRVKDD